MSGHPKQAIWRGAFAPAERAWSYPLPIGPPLNWAQAGAAWIADVALPPLPEGHLVVPSLAVGGGRDWRCELRDGEVRIAAAGIGRTPAQDVPPAATPAPAAAQVDCFATQATLEAPVVRFRVDGDTPVEDYLAVVSARPMRVPAPDRPPADVPPLAVPARSQMGAPDPLRSRICSPTCVSMTLDHLGLAHDFEALLALAFHRPSNLYGVWPQNLWAASRFGALGAVETATDWQAPRRALAAGHPMTASVAFAEGALAGSPLRHSGGHLVIVRGIENNRVFANDPAAGDEAGVPRSYDIGQFGAAWLARRGAFYLFSRQA